VPWDEIRSTCAGNPPAKAREPWPAEPPGAARRLYEEVPEGVVVERPAVMRRRRRRMMELVREKIMVNIYIFFAWKKL
jgi:hypothetical protein